VNTAKIFLAFDFSNLTAARDTDASNGGEATFHGKF